MTPEEKEEMARLRIKLAAWPKGSPGYSDSLRRLWVLEIAEYDEKRRSPIDETSETDDD